MLGARSLARSLADTHGPSLPACLLTERDVIYVVHPHGHVEEQLVLRLLQRTANL